MLGAPIITSRLVWGCIQALEVLARGNKVTLVWVSGYSGIRSNELADQLAKAGSESKLLDPKPALGIPFCLGRVKIRKWLRNQNLAYWREKTRDRCRQTRAFLEDSPARPWLWALGRWVGEMLDGRYTY